MKHIALTLAALFAAASVYAQGTVNFVNRIPGTLDAVTSGGVGVGNDYWAQLMAGPAGGALALVGSPVEFRAAPANGYIQASTVAIPGVAGGSPADVKMVAWAKSLGNTYPGDGLAFTGSSAVITVAATGNPATTPPGIPANLVGLTGFAIIPEPSIAALGLLGAGLLLIRRKK
jgi:hypothetical protein